MPQRAWTKLRERQLYAEAKDTGIKGRSKMSKAQLERAVGR
jgi:hypothetical protein